MFMPLIIAPGLCVNANTVDATSRASGRNIDVPDTSSGAQRVCMPLMALRNQYMSIAPPPHTPRPWQCAIMFRPLMLLTRGMCYIFHAP